MFGVSDSKLQQSVLEIYVIAKKKYSYSADKCFCLGRQLKKIY